MVYFTWMKHQSIELGLVCEENPLHRERERECVGRIMMWVFYVVVVKCCMKVKQDSHWKIKSYIIYTFAVNVMATVWEIIFVYICIYITLKPKWHSKFFCRYFRIVLHSCSQTNERKVCVYCSVQRAQNTNRWNSFMTCFYWFSAQIFFFLLFVVSRNNNFVLDIIQIVDSINFMLNILFSFLSPFCYIFNFVTMTTHDE